MDLSDSLPQINLGVQGRSYTNGSKRDKWGAHVMEQIANGTIGFECFIQEMQLKSKKKTNTLTLFWLGCNQICIIDGCPSDGLSIIPIPTSELDWSYRG
ncbi:hypothetical protein TNCV_4290321 [Trichonephila clavipes]|nr:hypothetical protein TNCV_4290321 [Trichonephila clavipes]